MKADFGTNSYSQWFFFKVSNLRIGANYKFNVMNMMKPDCLYNQGMKIVCCPISSNDQSHWKHEGKNIGYYRNCVQKRVGWNYYTLTFTITSCSESMYIASNFPYTYTELQNLLKEIETKKGKVKISTLCKTLAGNVCPLLTITNFQSKGEELAKRRVVVFTARVHPG